LSSSVREGQKKLKKSSDDDGKGNTQNGNGALKGVSALEKGDKLVIRLNDDEEVKEKTKGKKKKGDKAKEKAAE